MRPMVGYERGEKPCIAFDGQRVSVIVDNLSQDDLHYQQIGPWGFDYAMDSSQPGSASFCSNDGCYELMGKPLVETILKGFNACLFCYGQTGTGKTATIMGYPNVGIGLLPRVLGDIITEAEAVRKAGGAATLSVQMLEVHNEKIHDLLVEKELWEKTKIKTAVLPHGVQVKGASSRVVTTLAECKALLDEGDARKTVAATAMNPVSSRGHMVFKLILDKQSANGTKCHCEIYFADLAGHENIKMTAVEGERFTELKHINSSLMYLQRTIHSLAASRSAKTNYSIFRNSELTLLLANGLTGNSVGRVIITLSPAARHFDTSLSSIEFAMEVKGIKMDVHSNVTMDPSAIIQQLEAEVETLKNQLGAAQNGQPVPAQPSNSKTLSGENARLQLEMKALQTELVGMKHKVVAVQFQDALHKLQKVDRADPQEKEQLQAAVQALQGASAETESQRRLADSMKVRLDEQEELLQRMKIELTEERLKLSAGLKTDKDNVARTSAADAEDKARVTSLLALTEGAVEAASAELDSRRELEHTLQRRLAEREGQLMQVQEELVEERRKHAGGLQHLQQLKEELAKARRPLAGGSPGAAAITDDVEEDSISSDLSVTPEVVEGNLQKACPSGLNCGHYQDRYVRLKEGLLSYSNTYDNQTRGYINFIDNCECKVEADCDDPNLFSVYPQCPTGGNKTLWRSVTFTGDAQRVFKFCCVKSTLPRSKWIKAINEHISYGKRKALTGAAVDSISSRQGMAQTFISGSGLMEPHFTCNSGSRDAVAPRPWGTVSPRNLSPREGVGDKSHPFDRMAVDRHVQSSPVSEQEILRSLGVGVL